MTYGHKYNSQALEKGASAVVANQEKIPDKLKKTKFWIAKNRSII